MSILVTGAAGFIGFHVTRRLLAEGRRVIGLDVVNAYYDTTLKERRNAILEGMPGYSFHRADLADASAIRGIVEKHPEIDLVIHLAAQAGVGYSRQNPAAYVHSNLVGFVTLVEETLRLPALKRLVYASSSSVYGANTSYPFAVEDRTDHPISLYAATKKANEALAESYARSRGLKLVGLRFFTVYGPWGRPDMAAYLFADAIAKGERVKLFNNGQHARSFTYIDDIVAGVLAAAERPGPADHEIYNLGSPDSVDLMHFLALIEGFLGRKAEREYLPLQIGDVPRTEADIGKTIADLGWRPTTSIEEGLRLFCDWYRDYHRTA